MFDKPTQLQNFLSGRVIIELKKKKIKIDIKTLAKRRKNV